MDYQGQRVDVSPIFKEIQRNYLYGETVHVGEAIKPTETTAAKALIAWFSEYKATQPPQFRELTDEQQKRRRKRLRYNKKLANYIFDEAQLIVWSVAWQLMPTRVQQHWLTILPYTNFADKDRLKELGAIYKKYNYLLSDDWYYYVDSNLLSDYVDPLTPDEMAEAVREWVTGEMEHEFSDGLSFNTLFSASARLFMEQNVQPARRVDLSVEQFLRDPFLWATTGSSDTRRLHVTTRGKRIKARKSKWASAAALTIDELLRIFYDPKPQLNKATTKRELGKARMIIAGDMSNYLRMSYISYWLEDVMRDNPHMTMFYSTHKQFKMWLEMVQNTGQHVMYNNMPTDESLYDHHITADMIIGMFDAVDYMIRTYYTGQHMFSLLHASNLTRVSLVRAGHVVVRHTNGFAEKIPIIKGLLSGWRWTAFFNTVANGAKLNMYRYVIVARSQVPLDPTIDYSTLGDDIRARVRSLAYAAAIIDLYKETGFDVNPNKFFISKLTDEYLRKIALMGTRLTGYPLRGIAALCFSNPISRPVAVGETRIKEMFSSWMQVVKRMGTPRNQYYNLMISDIAQGNGVTNETVSAIVHAHATFGGCGLRPTNNLEVNWQPYQVMYDYQIDTPPLFSHLSRTHQNVLLSAVTKGIELTKQVPMQKQPFTVTFTQAPFLKATTYRPGEKPTPMKPMQAHIKYDYTPMEQMLIRHDLKRMNREQLREQIAKYLEPESVATFYSIVNRASLYIIRQWIDDKLKPSPPTHEKQGSLIASIATNNYYNAMLSEAFAYGRITAKRERTIRLRAELLTLDYLDGYELLMQE